MTIDVSNLITDSGTGAIFDLDGVSFATGKNRVGIVIVLTETSTTTTNIPFRVQVDPGGQNEFSLIQARGAEAIENVFSKGSTATVWLLPDRGIPAIGKTVRVTSVTAMDHVRVVSGITGIGYDQDKLPSVTEAAISVVNATSLADTITVQDGSTVLNAICTAFAQGVVDGTQTIVSSGSDVSIGWGVAHQTFVTGGAKALGWTYASSARAAMVLIELEAAPAKTAKTLLDAVNEILVKTGVIQGDTGKLVSLSDSARQVFIDQAIQAVNEGMDDLFSRSGFPKPKTVSESTLTLVTGQVRYSLDADVVRLVFPLIDTTNNRFITEYPGGYYPLLSGEVVAGVFDEGTPQRAAIDPTDGTLVMDRTPTAQENGDVFNYKWEDDKVLIESSDLIPFNPAVFRAMVPAWAEIFERNRGNRDLLDKNNIEKNMAIASRLMTGILPRTSWSPR